MTPTPHASGKEEEVSELRTKDADDLFVSMLKHETPDGRYGNEVLRRLRKLAEIEAMAEDRCNSTDDVFIRIAGD